MARLSPPYTWQDHLEHARHDETFLDYLISDVLNNAPNFSDWALVATFNAALHYTKAAILRDHGATAATHMGYSGRKGWVDGHNDLVRRHLPSVNVEYRELWDIGHEAR